MIICCCFLQMQVQGPCSEAFHAAQAAERANNSAETVINCNNNYTKIISRTIFIISARSYCDRACLLVGSLVLLVVSRFSKSKSSVFMKFATH